MNKQTAEIVKDTLSFAFFACAITLLAFLKNGHFLSLQISQT